MWPTIPKGKNLSHIKNLSPRKNCERGKAWKRIITTSLSKKRGKSFCPYESHCWQCGPGTWWFSDHPLTDWTVASCMYDSNKKHARDNKWTWTHKRFQIGTHYLEQKITLHCASESPRECLLYQSMHFKYPAELDQTALAMQFAT